MAVIKVIIAVCALVLSVRAESSETDSDTPMDVDVNTPVAAPAATSAVAPPTTPPSPTINLMLTDGNTVTETHECLKDFGTFRGLFKDSTPLEQDSPDAADANAPALPIINNPADYARYKALWAEKPAGEIGGDLTADEFARFFNLAVYMDIQGDSRQRFTANMVQRGLLGHYSAVILDHLLPGSNFGQGLFRHILLAFTEQLRYKAGVIGDTVVFYAISAEYVKNFQETMSALEDLSEFKDSRKTRKITKTKLVGCIPADRSDKPIDRAAVFGWLLCHSELYSLSFSLGLERTEELGTVPPPADFLDTFTNDLDSITQSHGDVTVAIEGLDLLGYTLDSASVNALMETYGRPHLKEVKMHLCEALDQRAVRILGSFTELETVHIRGPSRGQLSSVVRRLTDKLPKLKELAIDLGNFARTTAADFSGCSKIETLKIDGAEQSSPFVQSLLTHLPRVKMLSIKAKELDDSVAPSFASCQNLEALEIEGDQTSWFIQRLLSHVPKLKSLKVKVLLDETAAANFAKCPNLERLEIDQILQSDCPVKELLKNIPMVKYLKLSLDRLSDTVAASFINCRSLETLETHGLIQTSSFIKELLKKVPNLKSLSVPTSVLDDTVADSFVHCPALEVLRIRDSVGSNPQTSSFVANLLKRIPEIKELSLGAGLLNATVAAGFDNCPKLEKLALGEHYSQTSPFVAKLLNHVPEIKELRIRVRQLEGPVANGFANCPKLEALSIDGLCYQPSSFMIELAKQMPSIRQLTIWVDVLDENVGTALSKCSKLQKLDLHGVLAPRFFASMLQHPLFNSLKTLKVHQRTISQWCTPEDNAAIGAARRRSIVVSIS